MHHIITPESIVYQRPVQYYETDRMQIVHHSNYIRWMEEIRVAFMAQKGVPYDQMEHNGILMPVLGVTCSYHIPFQFGETFQATCRCGCPVRIQSYTNCSYLCWNPDWIIA